MAIKISWDEGFPSAAGTDPTTKNPRAKVKIIQIHRLILIFNSLM